VKKAIVLALALFACSTPPAGPALQTDSVEFTAVVGRGRPLDTVALDSVYSWIHRPYTVTGVYTMEGALPYRYASGQLLNYDFDPKTCLLTIRLDCSGYDGYTWCACDTALQTLGVRLRATVIY
jgi:hypothetical protein